MQNEALRTVTQFPSSPMQDWILVSDDDDLSRISK
jgi:hypothetical protein